VEAHILALRSLNLPFKYIITSLFLYPLLLGVPLPVGALRVRTVCLWVNPALTAGVVMCATQHQCNNINLKSHTVSSLCIKTRNIKSFHCITVYSVQNIKNMAAMLTAELIQHLQFSVIQVKWLKIFVAIQRGTNKPHV